MTHLEAYRKAGKMDEPKPATDPAMEAATLVCSYLARGNNRPGWKAEVENHIRQAYAPILAAADSMMEAIGNYFECSAPECEPACSECSTWLKDSADQYRKLTPKE